MQVICAMIIDSRHPISRTGYNNSVDFVEHDTILRIILKYEFLYIING